MEQDLAEVVRSALESRISEEDREATEWRGRWGPLEECRFVRQVVWSLLLWESSASKAERALEAILEEIADINELRVCLPGEMVGMIGSRYPRAEERSRRMRACLQSIYEREHKMVLGVLETVTKRDARAMLDGIEGMVPFVASRVMLLELGGHAFPMDGRLCVLSRGLLGVSDKPEELSSRLERVLRAGEIAPAYRCLERLHLEESLSKELARDSEE